MTAQRFNIVNGPSKFSLMVALFDATSANQRYVSFTILANSLTKMTISVSLNSATREDGSGQNWLFAGYLSIANHDNKSVKGYFSIKNRKGWIEIF